MKKKIYTLPLALILLFLSFVECNKNNVKKRKNYHPKPSLRWTIGKPEDDKRVADEMIAFMDKAIDPCDDFYEYACGQYITDKSPPANKKMDSLSLETVLRNQKILKEIFFARVNGSVPAENEAVKDAVKYYESCIDSESRANEGSKPLLDLLKELGTWSILEDPFDASTWSSDRALLELSKMGFNPLFTTLVFINPLNTNEVLLSFDRPSISYLGKLGRNLRRRSEFEWNFRLIVQAMKGMALFLGADERKMWMIDDLYEKLKPILRSSSRRRGWKAQLKNMTKITIEEFSKRTKMQLPSLLAHVNALVSSSGKVVDKDQIVAVFDIDDIIVAQDMFMNMTRRMRSLFLLSPLIWYSAGYLPGEFKWFRYFLDDFVEEDLFKSLKNFTKEQCYEEVMLDYNKVLWRLFADKMSTPEAKEDANNLVEDIRQAMIVKLHTVSWMDNSTRSKAVEKAIEMTTNVGYPEEVVSDDSLEKYYEDMDPSPTEFILNKYKMLRVQSSRIYSIYGKPNDRTIWRMNVFETNAQNEMTFNKIAIPTAFIQKRMYDPLIPRSYNYGALGAAVGHEIAHSYDWRGRSFDSHGSLKDWWSVASKIEYTNRAQCFRDQYNSKTYQGIFENGYLTLGENIADSEGLEIAYQAYQTYVQAHGKERTLPGIQLSNDKLFFLGFAQSFCTTYDKWYAQKLITSDEHALDPIRARTSLQNSPEFAAAYNCPLGSNMNPAKKCNIF